MNKKKILISLSIVIITLIFVFICLYINNKLTNTSNIIDTNIIIDNSDEDIDWSNYQTNNIELKNSFTINKEGIYHITGTIDNGMIAINTDGYVKLILDNVSITNNNGPAIYITKANKTIISTTENSINTLNDSTSYSNFDEDVEGAIYSKDDLVFEGDGILNINGNKKDAVVSKDNIKFNSGTYNITSQDDGIRGKDSVYIINGIFNINSNGDAIKSTNDSNSNLGYVKILDGTFNLTTSNDGIQAESKLLIENGTFNITSGCSSTNSSNNSGKWNNSTTTSAKGLKSGSNIVITNGTFNLDTSDDAIHSNNIILIKEGIFQILSGDDGIHADNDLTIEGGTITISKSYEGIEANNITINNGDISIVSSDDGINAAGGNDNYSTNRPGASNTTKYTGNSKITINNGNILVNASGDGIDANGSIYINGGNIIVNGPTDNGNGALDYDSELIITGGTLTAIGSSGMAQGISSNSSIYGVLIYLTNTYNSNTTISITDNENNEILSYTSLKSFSSIVFSSDKLQKDNSYNLYINGNLYKTFTINSINTTIGSNFNNMGGNRNTRR